MIGTGVAPISWTPDHCAEEVSGWQKDMFAWHATPLLSQPFARRERRNEQIADANAFANASADEITVGVAGPEFGFGKVKE